MGSAVRQFVLPPISTAPGSALLVAMLLTASACGGVDFQPSDPTARIARLSRRTVVTVVEDPSTLPQPVLDLGLLARTTTRLPSPQVDAVKNLREQATQFGCDAIGSPHEEPTTDVRGQPAFHWLARCLRSANSPMPPAVETVAASRPGAVAVTLPTPTPAPAPAPKDPAPENAIAEAKERTEALRKQAENADKERRRLEAEVAAAERENKRLAVENAAAEKVRLKGEAAERERERLETERKRKELEAADRKSQRDAAERKQQEAAAAARQAKEEAASKKLAAQDAEKQKKAADAAEKQRLAEEADKQKQAADEAERQRQVTLAAETARKQAETDKLGAIEAVAQRKAAAKQALEDKAIAPQIDFLSRWPDTEDSAAVFAALQRGAVEESANWLSEVKCAPAAETVERRLPPPTLAADLAEAKTTRWRSLLPRDVQCSYAVRNPTSQPVILDIDLPGGRAHRFLAAKQSGTVKEGLRCQPEGAPQKSVAAGVVEYRYGCAMAGASRVVGLRLAAGEIAIDKRAADPTAPLETLAKVWQTLPNTRLGQVYMYVIAERLRRATEDVSQVNGQLTVLQKPAADQPTPVRVAFRNTSGHDVTVLYTVGTGRDERLLLPKGGAQEVMLKALPNIEPDLRVTGVLPRLRSIDWLVGSWQSGAARLVLLPTASGGTAAFALVADATGMRHAVPAVTEQAGGVVTFKAAVGGAWLASLLGKVPEVCAATCEAQFTLKLSDQELYTIGGPRLLVVEVAAGGAKAMVKLTED